MATWGGGRASADGHAQALELPEPRPAARLLRPAAYGGLCPGRAGPPGADPEGTQSFAQQVEGDMKDTFANVKWGQKPDPAAMPGDPRQHYKP